MSEITLQNAERILTDYQMHTRLTRWFRSPVAVEGKLSNLHIKMLHVVDAVDARVVTYHKSRHLYSWLLHMLNRFFIFDIYSGKLSKPLQSHRKFTPYCIGNSNILFVVKNCISLQLKAKRSNAGHCCPAPDIFQKYVACPIQITVDHRVTTITPVYFSST